MASQKKRHWAFVLYPPEVSRLVLEYDPKAKTTPDNWREILSMCGSRIALSPLHDRDIDPDGNPKKPHYHVIICYDGPQTYSAVKSFTDSLACPSPEPLQAVPGYYRYFTHKDNPDKFQYDAKDITTYGGFDISEFSEMTKTEKLSIMLKIREIINVENIKEYADLVDYLADFDTTDYFNIASSNTLFFTSYLRSRRCSDKRVGEVIADSEKNAEREQTRIL